MVSAKGHYKAHYSNLSFTYHVREFKQYTYIYIYIYIYISYKSFNVLIYVPHQPSVEFTFIQYVPLKKDEWMKHGDTAAKTLLTL